MENEKGRFVTPPKSGSQLTLFRVVNPDGETPRAFRVDASTVFHDVSTKDELLASFLQFTRVHVNTSFQHLQVGIARRQACYPLSRATKKPEGDGTPGLFFPRKGRTAANDSSPKEVLTPHKLRCKINSN